MTMPLHRDPQRASSLVDELLRQPEKARAALLDALVGASAVVDTVNLSGGLVRNQRDELVPATDHDWLDLANAAATLESALANAGIHERLTENHD